MAGRFSDGQCRRGYIRGVGCRTGHPAPSACTDPLKYLCNADRHRQEIALAPVTA